MLSRLFRNQNLTLGGRIILQPLPPSQGYIVSAKLFPVEELIASPPFSSKPPAEAFVDSEEIARKLHFGQILDKPTLEFSFNLVSESGYCYLGITVFLFRESPKGLTAQLERFCLGNNPFNLSSGSLNVGDIRIPWPEIAIEEMQLFATFRPNESPEFYYDKGTNNE